MWGVFFWGIEGWVGGQDLIVSIVGTMTQGCYKWINISCLCTYLMLRICYNQYTSTWFYFTQKRLPNLTQFCYKFTDFTPSIQERAINAVRLGCSFTRCVQNWQRIFLLTPLLEVLVVLSRPRVVWDFFLYHFIKNDPAPVTFTSFTDFATRYA